MDLFDSQFFKDNLKPLLKQFWLPLALGLVGLILFTYGLIALLGSASNKNDLTFDPAKSASNIIQDNVVKIVVDVEGAWLSREFIA